MTLYGIRNKKTKNPLRISVFSNHGGEFCNDAGAKFHDSTFEDSIYMVTEQTIAEKSLKEDPDWYNASLERPQWPCGFKPDDYEVFSVDI